MELLPRSPASEISGRRQLPCAHVPHARKVRAPTRSRQPLKVAAIREAPNTFDTLVLRLPQRTLLSPEQVVQVFDYNRNFGEKYHLGKVLGYGSFGVVRDCMEKSSGQMYAVKTISKAPKGQPPTPRYLLKMRAEVEIMHQLGSSLDAVNLKEVFEDDASIHLVMQLCEGGELLDRINEKGGQYSEKYISGLVRSILRFVSQCHAKGFVYRDIKPGNFLFLTKEENSPLKATDFGLAVTHWPDEPPLKSRSGTPAYMAPELVMERYDEKCDLWSVGMLSYQLLTGRFPYWENVSKESLKNIFDAILTQEIDWGAKELKGLSASAVDFLQQLLHPMSSLRPSASDALAHPWLGEQSDAGDVPLDGTVVQRLQRFSTFGLLKQMVLKMVFDSLRDERENEKAKQQQSEGNSNQRESFIQSVKDLFNDMDSDKSGSIEFDELQEGLRRHGYVLSDSEVVQLGRRPDLNFSGNIDLPELMTALIDWSVLQREDSWQKHLDRAFKKLDSDSNGYISLEELYDQLEVSRVASACDVGSLIKEANLMLREADSNGDGVIGREEFNRLLQGSHAHDALSLYDTRLEASLKSTD